MAVNINAQFKNEEVKEFLKEFHEKVRKSKKGDTTYASLLSAIVYGDVINHFEQEEGPDGKWQPWSKSYLEAIQGKAFYRTIGGRVVRISTEGMAKPPKPPRNLGQILAATGKMRNNFKPTKYRSTTGGILWYNDAKTKSGFGYAGAHDAGGDKLPARPFMWLSEKAIEKVETQTLAYILEKGN